MEQFIWSRCLCWNS